jgi:hypothetical protein
VKSHTLDGRSFPIWVNLAGIREIHSLGRISNYSEIQEAKTNICMSLIEVGKDMIPFADFNVVKSVSLRDDVRLDDVTPKS